MVGLIKRSGVTFLSAHFGKEDGFVGDDEIAVNFQNDCLAGVFFESEEFGDNIGRNLSRTDYGLSSAKLGRDSRAFSMSTSTAFSSSSSPRSRQSSAVRSRGKPKVS